MPNQVVFAVLAFFFAWLATLVSVTLLLTAVGARRDHRVLRGRRLAQQHRPRAARGRARRRRSPALTDFQTWVCTVTMLLGRLELLTVLVILTPAFWRK